MTVIAEQMRSCRTDRRKPDLDDSRLSLEWKVKDPTPSFTSYRTLWWFKAEFGVQGYLPADAPYAASEAALAQAKRQVVEFVFGEFRTPLHQLAWEVRYGDREKAATMVEAILGNMYRT